MKKYQKHCLWTVKFLFIPLVIAVMSACTSGPTRTDDASFTRLKEGRIAPSNAQVFADCLLDGFDKAHFMLTNATSRQQRRSNSYRVETLAGGRILLISADVFDDGRVVLNESTSAALASTSGERKAFDLCLSKYTSLR